MANMANMKKLAVRLTVLAGCAVPLVLAAGAGTAGADPSIVAVPEPIPTTLGGLGYDCRQAFDVGCGAGTGICVISVTANIMIVTICPAIGTD